MIFFDESTIKINGVILPGILKSIEIKHEAAVEEQEIQGSAIRPKQAIGFEDAKINIELILEDSINGQTKQEKLQIIQSAFKKVGQAKPLVMPIINQHTATRNISKVIVKGLTTKEQSKKTEMLVSIELWEYNAITITAKKTGTAVKKTIPKVSTGNTLNANYKNYTVSKRPEPKGTAPKVTNKTMLTAMKDMAKSNNFKKKLEQLPYK